MNGVERIAAERQRQIDAEGYTPEHDAEHRPGDLAQAARSYLAAHEGWLSSMNFVRKFEEGHGQFAGMSTAAAECRADPVGNHFGRHPDRRVKAPSAPWDQWPWEAAAWKPSNDPIRNLEKAGALIAAEIDRLLAGAS